MFCWVHIDQGGRWEPAERTEKGWVVLGATQVVKTVAEIGSPLVSPAAAGRSQPVGPAYDSTSDAQELRRWLGDNAGILGSIDAGDGGTA